MLTRSYGDVDGRFKDGGSVMLMKGEKPRTPYPWRKYSACPHCGSMGKWSQSAEMGHCSACGTWVPREGRAPWRQEPDYPYKTHKNPPKEIVCIACGETFKPHAHGSKTPDRCEICRDRYHGKNKRERYRREREAQK
jgi:hypothetical protein